MACAGVLAAGLLFGGLGAGVALADGTESTGPSSENSPRPGKAGTESGGGTSGRGSTTTIGGGGRSSNNSGATTHKKPSSTFGNGRQTVDPKSAGDDVKVVKDDDEKKPAAWGLPGCCKHSLSIPVLRIPTPEEVTATGWPDPSAFFSTVDIPVPSIDGFWSALTQPQPSPQPTPGPAFRGQQEEAPVVEATVTGGGGGLNPLAAQGADPRVFEVPLVVAAPRPMPAAGVPAPLGATASGNPTPQAAAVAEASAAGARAPLIRGTITPTAEPAQASAMTPLSGQATRLGYPRYLSRPTVGELAAVALPGVGGLIFFTFSGGLIGYRQANSARFIRTAAAARFLE